MIQAMPELPEVETIRRALADALVGRRVTRARVHRPDVLRGPRTLLQNQRITHVLRLGKQLALVGDAGHTVCIHLGMSGSLRLTPPRTDPPPHDHIHLRWLLDDGSQLRFRDPRRFGGVWSFAQESALWHARWDRLGPDALDITPAELRRRLSMTRRAVKAALLDQHLVAGLGNIYVDELLFAVKLHPLRPADGLAPADPARLVRAMRRILGQAVDAGGTTLRDYVDASGNPGGFQKRHRVYGRADQPCHRCKTKVMTMVIAGRTTAFCPGCQVDATLTGER